MDIAKGKKTKLKRPVFTSSAFLAFTTLALVLGMILIILSRTGYTREGYFTFPPETIVPSTTPSSPVFVSGNSRGSLDAPVTIIVYSDFQCGNCQQFTLTTEKDLDRVYIETGKVRYIYKHFITYSDESILAAEASECAAEQNKFWPYYELVMQEQASPGIEDLTLTKLQTYAQIVGLNIDTFNDSLISGKFKDKVNRDTEEGKAIGVTGTPTFFINGIKGVGNAPFDSFREIIDQLIGGQQIGQ